MIKRKIQQLLEIAKEVERTTGWIVWNMGAYKQAEKIELYLTYQGQGVNENVYFGEYETLTNFEDIYRDWIHQTINKDTAVKHILERIDLLTSLRFIH